MVARAKTRASGASGAEEEAAKDAKQMLEPVQPEGDMAVTGPVDPDNDPQENGTSLTPMFFRAKTEYGWGSAERQVIDGMKALVDAKINDLFGDLQQVLFEIYSQVRTPVINKETGEQTGWEKTPLGHYAEDWSTITRAERERWLYMLTVKMVPWEQRAADLWGEALFAKVVGEEAFSHGYEDLEDKRATIEARTARARVLSAEHRYRAVYLAYMSKRAEAVVRSAERLGQRLKDLSV